jgi:dolichol-phosphate mannosyltransferase
MEMHLMRAVIIVPTYNEAENLPVLVERLLAIDPPLEVLIVDDSSPDGTGDLADGIAARELRFHVIHRPGPRGYSPSCVEGLTWALQSGYDYALTMDADLSHDPAVIPDLITAAEAGADCVIGSRYVAGGGVEADWSPYRLAVSRWGSAYARLMIGAGVRDCTSGFRCYRAQVLARVDLGSIRSEGYAFLIEVLARLLAQSAEVAEVPITYVDRQHGASKISGPIVAEALWRTTMLGVGRLAGR